jgi:ketosteroid isomerase-like protein
MCFSVHPNEVLLRREYESRARRDDDALAQVLAETVTWHVPGRSAISGVYRGKDAVMAYVRRRRALADDTFQITVEDVLANDRYGLVIATGHARIGGRDVSWRAHGLYRFENGKIAECRVVPEDQSLFDEIWS